MTIRQILTLFALLGWMAAKAPALEQFFLVMADPQFGMYTNNLDFAQETANLEFAIATANRLRPAFVVMAGDLANKGGDPAQIAEYMRVTHQLNPAIPLYNVAGNHDVGNSPTAASLEAYRKIFGKDYYTFRSGDLEGIVIDSSIIQHPEHVPQEEARQREWLELELKRASANGIRQLVIFQHIPWFLHDADEPDQYFNIPREARARYLKILEDAGVHYVFAGHLHQNSEGIAGTLRMVTTGPVGKPLGDATSGFRIVVVGHDKLCGHYYGLGNLPNQVNLSMAACDVGKAPPR
jgi:serine/threonine-protein phosphatase CPPED1